MVTNEDVIRNLNFLVKSYDAYTETVAGIKNRMTSLNPDMLSKHDTVINKLENAKNAIKRGILKELELYPIWNNWLNHVPGIGEASAGRLIMHYYYRFVPICHHCSGDLEKKEVDGKNGFYCSICGKPSRGDGVLKNRIEYKDFRQVSSWWAYMGRHVVDGRMPKRHKGVQSNWTTDGRTCGFHIANSFIRLPQSLYRQYYLARKAKRVIINPDATDGHRHNMASNEMVKLFLSHYWHVARTLEGLPTQGPYAIDVLGHTDYIPPYYWSDPATE